MKAPILRQLWPTTVLLSLGLWQPGVQAVEMPSPVSRTADISEFDLEKLMQIKVTSVSKRPESWFGSAAAIDVIIAEDIHRSSANNLPDALRGSPGLAVARQDSHTWAISPRGFNSELASKTLVLIDGRSVYAPLNAGVYWDAQDVVLEDINRIEVIRGPGGTLWGANAVNGVINITTKGAKDTQGLLVEGGGGSLERDFGTVRYGGQLGDHAWFRVYGKYFERENFLLPNGATAGDAWNKGQGGFRIDWEPSTANTFTLQGDLYEGHEHQTRTTAVPPPAFAQITNTLDRLAGGNVLGRWTHSFSADSQLKVQLYFDRTEREFFIPQEERSTVDLDVQHQFRLCDRQEIVWGLGYRWTGDSMRTNFAITFDPPQRDLHVFSAFVQDEITLVRDRLRVTLGSKLEHNDFTGVELQPSVRVAWTPCERNTIWAAVSRAVRTPSRAEDDVRILLPSPGGGYYGYFGDRSGQSEGLTAYELGWRTQPFQRFAFDLTAFYNQYDHLRLVTLGPPVPPSFPTFYSASILRGETYGAEAAASVNATDWWRLRVTYAFLRLVVDPDPRDFLGIGNFFEGDDPKHRVSLRSMMDLPGDVQFDVGVNFVDALRTTGISSYTTLDLRLAWRPTKNIEVSVVGQDLLDPQHAEFAPIFNPSPLAEVPRSVYAKLTLKF